MRQVACARQQTRVATFLLSCHAAMVRQLAIALALPNESAWHTELNSQLYANPKSSRCYSSDLVAPDPELLFLLAVVGKAWHAAATEWRSPIGAGVHCARLGICAGAAPMRKQNRVRIGRPRVLGSNRRRFRIRVSCEFNSVCHALRLQGEGDRKLLTIAA